MGFTRTAWHRRWRWQGNLVSSSNALRSSLMVGQVMHQRLQPVAHGFRYGLAMYRLDLDELDTINDRLRLFGADRPRPVSFSRTDHPIDVRARLRAEGMADAIERV